MSEKSKFVLTRGVLAWGVPMFILMTGWEFFLDRRHNLGPHFLPLLLVNLFLFPLLGVGLGLSIWKNRRGKSQKPSSS